MQFLQANSSLIFFGLALVFMLWMHSGGHRHGMSGGCGMGHQDHGEHEHDPQQTGPPVEVVEVAKPDPSEPVTPICYRHRRTHRGLPLREA
jgi:hypothetical protein